MLLIRTSNFRGATIRPITLYRLYCSSPNFLTRASSKNHIELFLTFKMKVVTANVKFEKENCENPT